MARIRTIKPDFFTSEDIVSISPLARLLFIATWLEADREGRLLWRPKTLKLRYLPGDNCDIETLANELINSGLVIPYEVSGVLYAEIPGFKRHQVVNNKEAQSVIPPRVVNAYDTRETHEAEAIDTRDTAPGTPLVGKERKEGKDTCVYSAKPEESDPAGFTECWQTYPKRDGPNPRKAAIKAYKARLRQGNTPEELLAGVLRYAAYAKQKNLEGTPYIKQTSTFFGPYEHWKEAWSEPDQPDEGRSWI